MMTLVTKNATALVFGAMLVHAPLHISAADAPQGGEELFTYHGCVNCHGASGKNPVSKVVPKIGGKSEDYIVENAKKILSGEGPTDKSKVMHAAFYSPGQCDAPPTDAEVRVIAQWLAAQ